MIWPWLLLGAFLYIAALYLFVRFEDRIVDWLDAG